MDELPINKLPSFKLGVAFVLPAPPTFIDPDEACTLCTLPMFCNRFASPVGGVFVNSPAVVETYTVSPKEKLMYQLMIAFQTLSPQLKNLN